MKLAEAFDPKCNSIGAIRLACALTVVVGHASPLGGYGDTYLMTLTNQQFSLARIAVDVFFILSGFLLVSSWERSTPLEYARNRFLRIYPALWACLLITGIIAPILFGLSPGYKYVLTNMPLIAGRDNHIPGMFLDNPKTGVNGALWTLPWELWCYVSIPALALVGMFKRRFACILFCALWLAFVMKITSTETLANKSAIVSPFRLFTFFYAGVLLHLFREAIVLDRRYAALAAAGLVSATVIGALTFPHAGGLFYIVAPIALSYLVVYAAASALLRNINSKTDISYGVYIYGTFFVQVLVANGWHSGTVSYLALAIMSASLAAIAGILSWLLVERPALALRRGRVAYARHSPCS